MWGPAAATLIGLLVASPASAQNRDKPQEKPKGPYDIALSGVFSPDRVQSDLEADAKKAQESGANPFARTCKFYFPIAANPSEFAALGRNTVFLIAVVAQKAEELPVKRVFIRSDGKVLTAYKISSWRTDVSANSLTAKMYGTNREDGFYLIPFGLMLQKGQIVMDLTANRTDWVMLELPSTVATNAASRFLELGPTERPNLAALQAIIKRRFTGFPVPQSLP